MRNLSQAVLDKINQNLGTEPVNIIEVQWVSNGPFLKYGDKDATGVDGVILEISTLESVVKLDGSGQSQGITVKLSDSSGKLKDIFDNHDIHGRTCQLYQWFEDMALTDRFKLYEGQITSPIEWSEGDRTLSFSVITQLEDKEVGFSPEEGQFPFIPKDKVGVAWPLVFGTVQNVPAVLINQIATTSATGTLSAVDPSLSGQLNFIELTRKDYQALAEFYVTALGVVSFTAEFGDTQEIRDAAEGLVTTLQQQTNQIFFQLANMNSDRSNLIGIQSTQSGLENTTLQVIDIEGFPTGAITLEVADLILKGTFDGTTFNIDNLAIPEYKGFDGEVFGFIFNKEGSTVHIQSDAPVTYIANILPSTIDFVQAYRQVENGRKLAIVPQEWFEVKTENIGFYTVTYLTFSKPLSSFDETYEDEIFVTLTSTIGPNTVDIIQWLVETYTNLTIDTTTFTKVKDFIENYPSHFPLLERRNILDLLEDIAFQARCAVWIAGGIVFIKYLAEEETEVDTFSEADIDSGSLSIFTTTTEELVTKLTAVWREDYAIDDANKIILRHNIKKYGTREREFDFFIYNIGDLVLKSATFWLIRFANVWKHIRFETYLHKLIIETFDTVKFNFADNFIADSSVNGMITEAIYNSDDKTITIAAWLPIKIGTMIKYDFAQPKDISVTLLFPTQEEIDDGLAGGDGPGAQVDSTLGLSPNFLASVNYRSRSDREEDGERIQNDDFGGKTPSDVGDTFPTSNTIGGEGAEHGEDDDSDYEYDDYPLDFDSSDDPEGEFSFSLPGIILSNLGGNTYTVNVFKKGIAGDPVVVNARQIGLDTEIPIGSGVLVAFNKWSEKDADGKVEEKSEYIIREEIKEVSFCYPGKILVDLGDGLYSIDVFKKGLNNSGTVIVASQLQIADMESLPAGTWVLIALNKWVDVSNEGIVSVKSEYTMQVPVWL